MPASLCTGEEITPVHKIVSIAPAQVGIAIRRIAEDILEDIAIFLRAQRLGLCICSVQEKGELHPLPLL
jgi:hypothetical protein